MPDLPTIEDWSTDAMADWRYSPEDMTAYAAQCVRVALEEASTRICAKAIPMPNAPGGMMFVWQGDALAAIRSMINEGK